MPHASTSKSLPKSRLLVASILAAAIGHPLAAADGVVGPGNCHEAGFNSVLDQVQGSGGGTITFNCGAAPTTIAFTGYKQISSTVTIDGGDRITFDGGNNSAFFQVFFSGSLHLRRLNLRRGVFNASHALESFGNLRLDNVEVAQGTGTGSALVSSGQLTIAGSRFIGNAIGSGSTRQGAAIRVDGGSALVTGSRFDGNTVSGNLGRGGAVAAMEGELTIRHSQFTGNQAFDGGAVYVAAGVMARIEHSRFSDNQAGYGGAIESWTNDIQVLHSRFDNNTADTGDGGAIWSLGGSSQLVVNWSEFSGNSAATTGGAISCYEGVLAVINSAFLGNDSTGNGGGIYSTCGLSVMNATFDGNLAQGDSSGGGALAQHGPRLATLTFVTAASNNAGFGGGIYNDGAGNNTLDIGNSILAGNGNGNCAGVLDSNGYNLSSDSHCGGAFTGPGDGNSVALALGVLGDHGGPTRTRLPLAGNPAINRVPPASCGFPWDQRGAPRPFGGNCDSGAVEVGSVVDLIFADGFQ